MVELFYSAVAAPEYADNASIDLSFLKISPLASSSYAIPLAHEAAISDSCVIQEPLTLQAGPYMTMPVSLPANSSDNPIEAQREVSEK
jgi:hypothetical protein